MIWVLCSISKYCLQNNPCLRRYVLKSRNLDFLQRTIIFGSPIIDAPDLPKLNKSMSTDSSNEVSASSSGGDSSRNYYQSDSSGSQESILNHI